MAALRQVCRKEESQKGRRSAGAFGLELETRPDRGLRMPKFRVIYVNGKFIDIKADKFADGTAKTLPPFYDFYKDCSSFTHSANSSLSISYRSGKEGAQAESSRGAVRKSKRPYPEAQ